MISLSALHPEPEKKKRYSGWCFFIGKEKNWKRPSRRRKQKAKQDTHMAAGPFQDATMRCVKRQKAFWES